MKTNTLMIRHKDAYETTEPILKNEQMINVENYGFTPLKVFSTGCVF